jgi:hypothetical protein
MRHHKLSSAALACHTWGTLQLYPLEPLVPVCIIPGDECNPVDYVFISVDPDITQEPWLDLLEKVLLEVQPLCGATLPDRAGKTHTSLTLSMRPCTL